MEIGNGYGHVHVHVHTHPHLYKNRHEIDMKMNINMNMSMHMFMYVHVHVHVHLPSLYNFLDMDTVTMVTLPLIHATFLIYCLFIEFTLAVAEESQGKPRKPRGFTRLEST
jgi:hypothetical protein